ncbi:MAG TPA: hypothetical protein VIJ99_06390 [Acidimicrobiales bacterium]
MTRAVRRWASIRARWALTDRGRSGRSEAGDTLVEVLLALIVLGLASVALLIAFSTSISASATHRKLATSDIVLSAVSQQAIASINSQLKLFQACQSLAYFQTHVPMSVPSQYSASYSVQLTSVQYWNPSNASFGSPGVCTVQNIDQPVEVTVTVTNNGHSYSNSFVVDYPLAGATSQSGAGAAAGLFFTTAPSTSASTSIPFDQQPVLEVEDAAGNAVTTDLSPVIISIQSGTSGALAGCSGSEDAGVITFSGCELTQAGTYTLMATDGNLATPLANDPTITVTGSSTPYLVFTTEPVAGTSGSAFSTEPVIKVYLGGSVDTSWPNGTLNLATSGGLFGPSSCTTPTVTSGVAALPNTCTFAGGTFYDPVSNQTLAIPYTMSASGIGLIPATSTTFKVSGAGTASQLVFDTEPSGVSAASASTAFTTQPVVNIEDAFGNVVTTSSATVTLALNSNSFNASLSGCSSTTVKGVATFSGCQLNNFGTGFTLQASSTGLPSVASSTFNITGLPSSMQFTVQPAAGVSGSTLPTQPIVTIYDSSGRIVTASTTAITLTPSGGSLTLCTNLTPYQGVVTVATCNFAGTVGTSYTLTATQGAVTVISNPISPTGAGVATQLAFTTDPVAGAAGSTLTVQPIVKVEDSAGNVVLTSSATISLSSAPTTGTLSSCDGLTAVSGVVNVNDCAFGGVLGTQYAMTATSGTLAPDTSANFSVTGPGPIDSIVLSGCASNIQWNSSCTATATVYDAWGNIVTPFNTGITFAQVSGSGAVTGLSTVTAVNGVASDVLTGSVVGNLQVNATGASVASNSITVTVVGIPQSVAFYTSSSYATTTTSANTTYIPAGSYQTYALGSATPPGTIVFATTTPSVCTVSGTGLVAVLSAGTCGLTADALATPHYADSGTTPFTLTIAKANQAALTVTSTSGTYPTSVSLTTSGGTGTGGVTYTVVNGTATGCSVSGATLNFTSAGTCLVTATKATDTNYNAISSAQTTVTIAKGNQAALTITSTTGAYPTSVSLTTSGGTGTGGVTYTVVNGTATGCSVSGATLSFTSAGTCLVTATKAFDSGYNAISSAQTTVTIAKGNQAALTITSTTGAYPTSVTLTTSGGSGSGAVSYVLNAGGTATGCSVSGATLSFTSPGTCFVTATKALDTGYNAISSAQTTVTISKGNQATLTVSPTTGTYPTSVTLSTSGGTGTGAVSYAVVNGTATGCSVSGTTLSFASAGTCLVTATKAFDTNYNAISSAQTTVTIAKGNQAALTITSTSGTFTGLTLAYSGGTTGGAVTYVVNAGGSASGCGVSGSGPYILSATSIGTCLVTATMAGTTGYNAVSSVSTTITLGKSNQATLTVTSTSGTIMTALTLTDTGGSGTGLDTFAVVNGTATGCTVNGTTPGPYNLTATTSGTCLVTATSAADTNYNVATSAQTTVTLYGTKLWSGVGANSTTVTSQSFTAPLGETVLVVVTYEGSTAHTCATPTGSSLNTYVALANTTYDSTGGNFQLCTYSAQGTGSGGAITETFSGTEVASVIGVIEITGDNNATLTLAKATSNTSSAPSFALTGAPSTGASEFLFGALDNASGTPPTWNAISGFSEFATATMGSGSTAFEPIVYFGAPAATTVTGSTSASATWGTIGIEVLP